MSSTGGGLPPTGRRPRAASEDHRGQQLDQQQQQQQQAVHRRVTATVPEGEQEEKGGVIHPAGFVTEAVRRQTTGGHVEEPVQQPGARHTVGGAPARRPPVLIEQPLEGLDSERRQLFAILEAAMPGFVALLVNHHPRALRGKSLS